MAAILVLLLLAQVPILQSENGTVTGAIRSATGKPAAGVRVTAMVPPNSVDDVPRERVDEQLPDGFAPEPFTDGGQVPSRRAGADLARKSDFGTYPRVIVAIGCAIHVGLLCPEDYQGQRDLRGVLPTSFAGMRRAVLSCPKYRLLS